MSDNKKETKTESKPLDPAMAEALRLVAEQMIPAAVASAVAAVSSRQPAAAPSQSRMSAGPPPEICQDCKQELRACKGKHVMAVVFPQRYPHTGDYFTGIVLNGVKYLSNDASHKILIPENALTSIQQMVETYEQNEQDMSVGRKVERHSGSIGPGASGARQQHIGWR